jgi:hypothetical protein
MKWYIYDARLELYIRFDTKEQRDAAFNAAQYIDQKNWWLGHDDVPRFSAYPD